MTAVARHTDPTTSHEAAATVDLARSQEAVLMFARRHLRGAFTDKTLVARYRDRGPVFDYPALSDSRIRTARGELAGRGLLTLVGETRPEGGRRERLWEVTR